MAVSPRAASRRLGQHFLVDPGLQHRVVAAAGIRREDEVLEIGAGPGTLTAALVPLARRVVAVEVDRRLLPRLREAAPGAEIVHGDILRLDPRAWFPRGGEVVVGNVPYYLTGALMPRLLQPEPRPRRLSLVVQREVARRWCGMDGWSLATVAVQAFTEPRVEFELPPAAFDPPPRVTSALVVMEVRPRPAVEVEDLDAFFGLVALVFQFRRKQLRGALARARGISMEEAGERLRAVGVEPTRRAETLTLQEWETICLVF
jgi:16S rRNA (adenine1518-N6/adenine1519-N6)-dimethyltransferase